MPASLVKAYMTIIPPAAAAGASALALVGGGETIPFQYNPTEYRMKGSASFPSTPVPSAPNAPPTQFRGTEPRQISIEIFLDADGDPPRNVEQDVKKLFECLTPHASTMMGAPSPPVVLFGWGASPTPQFKAVLTAIDAKFSRFDESGKTTLATCQISAKEVLDSNPGQNPTSGSPDAHSTHVIVVGETLPLIAFREYRDAGLWRAIAEMNGIDDPMSLRSGTRLLIPSVEEAEEYV